MSPATIDCGVVPTPCARLELKTPPACAAWAANCQTVGVMGCPAELCTSLVTLVQTTSPGLKLAVGVRTAVKVASS